MNWTIRITIVAVALSSSSCTGEAGSPSPAPSPDGQDAGANVVPAPTCESAAARPCPPREHATWPMPNPPSLPLPHPGRIEIDGDIAIDRVTGLVWQREFTPLVTWHDAVTWCQALSLAGHGDWRLPSRIELVSIVDFTRAPTLDPHAFPDTPIDYFWSWSTVPFAPEHAYSVYFGAGLTAFANKDGESAHARCVRGGRPGAAERFSLTDESALDLNTGLEWQRSMSPRQLTFDAAERYCRSLESGGAAAWRMPSTKELQTLVDETRIPPLIDGTSFPDTPGGWFWTGATIGKANLQAAYVDFSQGITEETSSADALYVRCVR